MGIQVQKQKAGLISWQTFLGHKYWAEKPFNFKLEVYANFNTPNHFVGSRPNFH